MNYVTKAITDEEKKKIINFYADKKTNIKGDYLTFSAKDNDVSIFIYTSKKGNKVVFQGESALNEASIFFKDVSLNEKKEKIKTEFLDFSSQIGSDEVGTGDLFGPLVVVACYYDEQTLSELNFKIDDSKKLTDDYILKTMDKLLPHLTYSKYTLSNEKYNALNQKGYSMNAIKAILHNLALTSLSKKVTFNNIYIDQFCEEELYYAYLKKAEAKPLKNIKFYTKGESRFPSIALASMIARYSFLKSMEDLNKKYDLIFPKGASNRADIFLKAFINKYGIEELNKVAKLNFKNIKELDK